MCFFMCVSNNVSCLHCNVSMRCLMLVRGRQRCQSNDPNTAKHADELDSPVFCMGALAGSIWIVFGIKLFRRQIGRGTQLEFIHHNLAGPYVQERSSGQPVENHGGGAILIVNGHADQRANGRDQRERRQQHKGLECGGAISEKLDAERQGHHGLVRNNGPENEQKTFLVALDSQRDTCNDSVAGDGAKQEKGGMQVPELAEHAGVTLGCFQFS
mmetsp:Transcript_35557/g.49359  ORF Transcript_35557/g.49359 Transcript_35557/m.49359 type:complete len:214 (+) Transcript_35557:79-720(+)